MLLRELFATGPHRRKNVLMSMLIFLSVIGYNLMRGMKEAHILNAPGISAVHISFIKMLLVLPTSALIGSFYLWTKHNFGLVRTYFATTLLILSYFILFTYGIAPNMSMFTLAQETLASLAYNYPQLQFVISVLGIWPSALFYAMAELWGTFSLIILFWQIANEIFSSEEAKLCYPALQTIGGLAILVASYIIKMLSRTSQPLVSCTNFMVLLAFCMLTLVYLLSDQIPTQPTQQTVNKKKKASLRESFTIAIKTPYILYLSLCICAFGVLVSIFDYSVKEVMASFYPGENGYLQYYSIFTELKGYLAILANIFTYFYLRRLGWFFMAALTPFICILSANTFLATSTLQKLQWHFSLGISNYWYAWVCCLAVVLIYASKYAFFDTTKEMAFIPLSDSLKTNGKAAVDGIGGRVGKVGSGLIQITICQLTGFDTYEASAPYLFLTSLLISVVWVWALLRLNSHYQSLTLEEAQKTTTPDQEADEAFGQDPEAPIASAT